MNALIKITILQWMRSPARMALFMYPTIMIVLTTVAGIIATREVPVDLGLFPTVYAVAPFFVIVLSTGIVSREREDGVLASVLVRPIRRSTYIFSKWLALAIAGFVGCVLFIMLATLITSLTGLHQPNLAEIGRALVESFLITLGLSATMVAFSTLSPTYGDLVLYALSWMGAVTMLSVISALTEMQREGFLTQIDADYLLMVAQAYQSFLLPNVQLTTPPHLWLFTALTYLSNLFTALLASVFFLNRKEIGYGG